MRPLPGFDLYAFAALLLAVIGALIDVRSRRLPNWLTGPGFLAGILLHFGVDGWHGVANATEAALIAFVLFLLFFVAGGMGAGDVKLMTACACLTGTGPLAVMLIATAVTGGIFAVALAVTRGRFQQMMGNVQMLVAHHRSAGLVPHPELNVTTAGTLRLPYGVAIASGCLCTLIARL